MMCKRYLWLNELWVSIFLQLLMKSNKIVLLTAIVHYVSKGEMEFRDICETLRVSGSKQFVTVEML